MTSKVGDRALPDVSRRTLFKQVGAATLASAPLAVPNAMAQEHALPANATAIARPRLEARETLTAAEAEILEAIVSRLIPSDDNGPGATEARAAYYIDRALMGPLRYSREAYGANLLATDAYAMSTKGTKFAQLGAADQDAVLIDVEQNVAPGFSPNAATFFKMVRDHTIQGMFCDPYYGGNTNFIGWDLIDYPGIRMAVGEDDQRLKAPEPVRASAYDDQMFAMQSGHYGHRP